MRRPGCEKGSKRERWKDRMQEAVKTLLKNEIKQKQPSPPTSGNKNPSVFKFFLPSLPGTRETKLQWVKQLLKFVWWKEILKTTTKRNLSKPKFHMRGGKKLIFWNILMSHMAFASFLNNWSMFFSFFTF